MKINSVSEFLKRQFKDIKELNKKALIRKTKKLFLYFLFILLIPITLPIIFIIRIINKFFLIRIGSIPSSRIGHFCLNTEIYLCKKNELSKKIKVIDFLYLNKIISNNFLKKKWSKIINFYPRIILEPLDFCNSIIPFSNKHKIKFTIFGDRDVENLLPKNKPFLNLTSQEILEGEKFLLNMGIKKNDKIVCLNVRDDAFLKINDKSKDWSYHSYRDANIENFLEAAEYLAEKKYFVFRMGVKVNKKFLSNNKRIIDYATNGMRTEFLDFFLAYRCEFCITTGSGYDAIPQLFRKPLLYVSYSPLAYLNTFNTKNLTIFRTHLSLENNKEMSLKEIFSKGAGFIFSTQGFKNKKIKLLESTSSEIKNATEEMVQRLENTWEETEDNKNLQSRFWEIYNECINNLPVKIDELHGDQKSKIGYSFLKKKNFI
ncbi:TIGR04372 family glycosyltransferase [Candidatus Pelagibacter sp.]|uniref:TIGR04372 family glycosyltransferase n=1 Tax=Candidatus Pelagibacter sp. TaxID=2024849 RepID=UPI003D0D3BBE